MKPNQIKWLMCAAIPAYLLGGTGRAYSQPSQPSQEVNADDRVGEIVVTAQKRSQSLQRVPIAISAIEGGVASALGVKDTTDLEVATPGLVMHHQSNALTPSMRGISQSNAAAGDESPIAIYVDGVYYASMNAGIFSFNNVERIEVLKGPQGTLFGRNAAGGVIQVITRRPQQDPYIDLRVGYGNYDTYTASFYGTTGIAPNLAADLAVYENRQQNGWGTNVTTGRDTFRNHELALRSKWLWTLGGSTEVTAIADYNKAADPLGSAKDALPGTLIANGGPHVGGFYDLREDTASNNIFKQWGGSVQVNHDFDWARLVSISAYRGGKPSTVIDQDSIAVPNIILHIPYKVRQLTQELQLLSPDSSRIKWIAGLFYLNNNARSVLTQSGLAFGAPGNFTRIDAIMYTRSVAGFGEVTVPFGDSTHLTAGGRFTHDTQQIVSDTSNQLGPVRNSHVDKKLTFNRPTWRLSLDHQFTRDLLAYASYNRGYKSGVFNTIAPADDGVKPMTVDAFEVGVKSEWLDGKLRVNGSAFYYDLKNIQLQITVPGATRLINAAAGKVKGGDLDIELIPIRRLSLRAGIAYTDSKYEKFYNAPYAFPRVGGGYTITPLDGSGNQMIYTPPWTVSASAQYRIPTDSGTYGMAVNYYYNGGLYPDTANQFHQHSYNLVNASLDWTSRDDRWSVTLWGKNLTNVEYYNHITVNRNSATASPSAPRTYGVTLGVKWH
jgi:iron complex outermembrane receptor protein